MNEPENKKTILEVLKENALKSPDKVAFTFVNEELNEVNYTNKDVVESLNQIGHNIKGEVGDRVLLLFPHGTLFIKSFFGVMEAGMIAVPCSPPRNRKGNQRVYEIIKDCKPRYILTSENFKNNKHIEELIEASDVEVLTIESLLIPVEFTEGKEKTDLAFIQYTSGTTGSPKGVMVSHDNILDNQSKMHTLFNLNKEEVILSWLPYYHDMGLIGSILYPIYSGNQCILISPIHFFKFPKDWLRLIHKYKVTVSGAPNFGFNWLTEKVNVQELKNIDLSSWRVAFNGAEVVRGNTLLEFSNKFGSIGFSKDAFAPCYGLAESTLIVSAYSSQIQKEKQVWNKGELVSSGNFEGAKVIIIDKKGDVLQEGESGEICVSSNSVARGYWGKPKLSKEVFQFQPNGLSNNFLRTGDIGFLKKNSLTVTGRIKDLIILKGRNIHAEDIEWCISSIGNGFQNDGVACFSIDEDDEEKLIVVAEFSNEYLDVASKGVKNIQKRIFEEFDISIHDIVLIRKGTIPKTTSGKIKRKEVKSNYLKKELYILAIDDQFSFSPKGFVLNIPENFHGLYYELTRILKIQEIDPSRSFWEYGMDSVKSMELIRVISDLHNFNFDIIDLYECNSFIEVLGAIEDNSSAKPKISSYKCLSSGVPLEFQKEVWFMENAGLATGGAFHIPVRLEFKKELNIEIVRDVLNRYIKNHELFRFAFSLNNSLEFEIQNNVEIAVLNDSNIDDVDFILKPFDLTSPPLFRVLYKDQTSGPAELLFVFHQIIMDGVGVSNFLRDFKKSLSDLDGVRESLFQFSSYINWRNEFYSNSEKPISDKAFWCSELEDSNELRLETRFPLEKSTFSSIKANIEETDLEALFSLSKRLSVSQTALIYTAFLFSIRILTKKNDLVIGMPFQERTSSELIDEYGVFLNTIFSRIKLENHLDTYEIAKGVNDKLLEYTKHSLYPSSQLLKDLDLVANSSNDYPLTGIFFNDLSMLLNGESDNVFENYVSFEDRPTNFDLDFYCYKSSTSGLKIRLDYNKRKFDKSIANSFLETFKSQLQLLVVENGPLYTQQSKPIIKERENDYTEALNLIQSQFNNSKLWEVGLSDYVERQVKKTPDRKAIVFKEGELTYSELNNLSNILALELQSNGLSKGEFGVLLMEKTIDVPITFLALMKLGCIIVPYDITWPKERIKELLDEINPKLICFNKGASSIAAEFTSYNKIEVNALEIPIIETDNVNVPLGFEDPVYGMYTSGSTGRPKCAINTYHGLINRLVYMGKRFGNENVNSIFTSKYDYDAGLWQIFWPLINGGLTVVPADNEELDFAHLVKLIDDNEISSMDFIPTVFNLFVEFLEKAEHSYELKSLKNLLIGGEYMNPNSIRRFKTLYKKIGITNTYGATEASMGTVFYDLEDEVPDKIPIGRPIDNVAALVLNENMELCSVGEKGELYLGGVCVSNGYYKDESKTSKVFLKNHISELGCHKLYKTGDIVAYDDNLNLQYIGRNDSQIKINGIRIEPEEIENKLLQLNEVHGVAVLIKDSTIKVYLESKFEGVKELAFEYLKERLPKAILPKLYCRVSNFPKISLGKVDKRKLATYECMRVDIVEENFAEKSKLEDVILSCWQSVLNRIGEQIGLNTGFFDAGGDSISIVKLRSLIKDRTGKIIPVTKLFQNPTIREQAILIGDEREAKDKLQVNRPSDNKLIGKDIAVIGLSIKAPGANNIEEFWDNLVKGKETISQFSDNELANAGVLNETINNKDYVKSSGIMEDKQFFDAAFFDYHPNEAQLLDPKTRVFHETVWNALEDAGYTESNYGGKIGLFAGASSGTLWEVSSYFNSDSKLNGLSSMYLRRRDFMCSLIANKLGLKGPVNLVDTACSTSLVAIDQAYKSLILGESDVAVAGGITISKVRNDGYQFVDGLIRSKDGHTNTFDESACGTVFGEGSGAVVLKPLDKAISDGDNIYAVIKGSAVNNDGNRKVGYTAPSVEGQSEVINEALLKAGISPNTIGYVEAHGTATKLGDPIEVQALNEAFGNSDVPYCALGSVKSNVGHLDTAAGVTGFIKTVLCLKNRKLVPTVRFNKLNPEIDLSNSPFYINTQLKDWESNDKRRAGVSSFGVGGTNAHIVLEEQMVGGIDESVTYKNDTSLFVISGKTKGALVRNAKALSEKLKAEDELKLEDVCFTSNQKSQFKYRHSIVSSDIGDLTNKLNDVNISSAIEAEPKGITFMFSGQGAQYVNMGKGLYKQNGVFTRELDNCFSIARKISSVDFKSILFNENESERINATQHTQPILFMFEYALYKHLGSKGVKPNVLLGHSLGEYTAACVSGVFSLEDAIKLVVKRGELIARVPKGSMLSVYSTQNDINAIVPKVIDIATVNTNSNIVVAGETDDIISFKETLEQKGISSTLVNTSHAFHSFMMDPILEEFKGVLESISFSAPRMPFYSNVTGCLITNSEATSSDYWVNHLRSPVKFVDILENIKTSNNNSIIVEVGPGRILTGFAQLELKELDVFSSIRHPKEKIKDTFKLNTILGCLWEKGITVNLDKINSGGRKISLPTYQFEKVSYGIGKDMNDLIQDGSIRMKYSKSNDISSWFYEPTWIKERINNVNTKGGGKVLVFVENTKVYKELQEYSDLNNESFVFVEIGKTYHKKGESNYCISSSDEDLTKVFEDLKLSNEEINKVLYWPNVEEREIELNKQKFFFVTEICKSLTKYFNKKKLTFLIVSQNLENILGEEKSNLSQSLVIGGINVISQEFPTIRAKSLDLDVINKLNFQKVFDELYGESKSVKSAIRGKNRWRTEFNKLNIPSNDNSGIRKEGVYIITGGLGNLGATYASYLLEKYNAKVILVGRNELTGEKENILKELKTKGEVSYYKLNLGKEEEINDLFGKAEDEYNKVNGIIHAAGIVGGPSFRPISILQAKDCIDQFSPKVDGSIVLLEAVKGKDLDFVVLVSSISSFLGGKEFMAYATSNSYMNYLAESTDDINVISISLDALQFGDDIWMTNSINNVEACKVLDRSVQPHGVKNLIVSVADFHARFNEWVLNTKEPQDEELGSEKDIGELDRNKISALFKAASTDTEKSLSTIFCNYLNIEKIGINDDFFELGGDSLKAMGIITKVHHELKVDFALKDFFEQNTIKQLSQIVDNRTWVGVKSKKKNEITI